MTVPEESQRGTRRTEHVARSVPHNAEDRPVVGVDLGGTKIVAALVSPAGEVRDRERAPTEAGGGPEVVISRLLSTIDRLLERNGLEAAGVKGISVAAAGPIDMDNGVVTTSPNLPGWHEVPLRGIMATRYGIDAFLINDAKAAALGEHTFGAGTNIDNLICVTLGTGIGGGIVTRGHLYLGKSGAAGEIGHMTIDVNGPKCSCGNVGCWEVFASGTAMSREAARRLRSGQKSSLSEAFAKRRGEITPVEISEAARRGDLFAKSVVEWSAGYLGAGMVNLVNIFNPEMIVIGGGMSKMADLLLEPAVRIVRERAFPLPAGACSFVISPIADDAGVLGAAAFALRKGIV